MAVQHNTLDELERQRLELEENVRQLRQSLYNWRLWEAEYDGLRDELKGLGQGCTRDEMLQAGIDLEGTVVDEKEVKALIGDGQGIARSRDQVVQQISRRLDYVKQNVASIEKRLATAEVDLYRLLSVEQPGPNAATENYAVTEIFEELDDNGEVLSSKISTPADRAPEVMDMLKKAGLEMPEESGPEKSAGSGDKVEAKKDESKTQSISHSRETLEQAPVEPAKDQTKPIAKETVAANAEANSEDSDEDLDLEYIPSEIEESPEDAKLRREMLEYSFHEVGKVVAELEMDEEGSDLSYDDDYDEDEYDEEEEDEYGRTTTSVLTEDYHQQMKELEEKLQAGGFINLGPANKIPAEARGAAEEASQAGILKVTSIERDADLQETVVEQATKEKKPKKKVAFADELDIATEPATSGPTAPKPERKIDIVKPEVAPLSDSIVERSSSNASTSSKDTAAPNSAKKKASRFKSARKDGTPTPGDSSSAGIGSTPHTVVQQPALSKTTKSDQAPISSSVSLFPARPAEPKPFSRPIIPGGDIFSAAAAVSTCSEPEPPKDKITADTLVERPPHAIDTRNALPPDPDDIDEEIHRKEIATEFYRRRNIKIQQSGGFLKDDDEREQEQLYELDENDQPKRRVSKFKAARVRP